MAWMQTDDNCCGREQPEWPGWRCCGCGRQLCTPKHYVPPPCECRKTLWHGPSDEPDIEVGDRLVVIVRERDWAAGPRTPRLVILQATENGWASPDPTYGSYEPSWGDAWAYEKDVMATRNSVQPESRSDG